MTNQEAFDKVCAHLLRPNFKKSMKSDDSGYCAYAGPEGNSCAIGCLLPRELGEQLDRLDEGTWKEIRTSRDSVQVEAVSLLSEVDPDLLIDLQRCHDCSAHGHRSSREERLRHIAKIFNLTFPETK